MAFRSYTKYHSKRVIVDGIEFQSKKEAKRWIELNMLQKAGKISGLQRQKKFVLIPAQYEPESTGPRGGKIKGKLLEREVSYLADFVYFDEDLKEFIVEDAKGFRTPEYIIKRKLLLWLTGYHIKEV